MQNSCPNIHIVDGVISCVARSKDQMHRPFSLSNFLGHLKDIAASDIDRSDGVKGITWTNDARLKGSTALYKVIHIDATLL